LSPVEETNGQLVLWIQTVRGKQAPEAVVISRRRCSRKEGEPGAGAQGGRKARPPKTPAHQRGAGEKRKNPRTIQKARGGKPPLQEDCLGVGGRLRRAEEKGKEAH